ncbi:MAG TPA: hypothetical protein VMV72_02530 [Verrucomicrobiae bacterium]|nr:hypothetical protein [Verrucomicrobiae bacterium]
MKRYGKSWILTHALLAFGLVLVLGCASVEDQRRWDAAPFNDPAPDVWLPGRSY